jgi:tetratricopeptide (TPR) repeat protein
VRNGYAIEIFETAEDQLRYARAWFSDPQEKQAALEVLIEQYPEANTVRAEAELELAYLALGADYRFADEGACLLAIGKYQRIAVQFSRLADICAKAHWYMGWIYADLLRQNSKAVIHFQTIVSRYPDATLRLESPVPWVSLVMPQFENQPQVVYERPVYSWRSMALLEIIRNSEDQEEQWVAFEKLWSSDITGAATGHALRALLLGSPGLAKKAVGHAQFYLQAQLFSGPMAAEIRAVLSRQDLQIDAESRAPGREGA